MYNHLKHCKFVYNELEILYKSTRRLQCQFKKHENQLSYKVDCNGAAKCSSCSSAHDAMSKECLKVRDKSVFWRWLKTHIEAVRAICHRRHCSWHRRDCSAPHIKESTTQAQPPPLPHLLLPTRNEEARVSKPLHSTEVQGDSSSALNTLEAQWPSLPSKPCRKALAYRSYM